MIKLSDILYNIDIECNSYSKSSDKAEILVIGGSDISSYPQAERTR